MEEDANTHTATQVIASGQPLAGDTMAQLCAATCIFLNFLFCFWGLLVYNILNINKLY